MIVPSVGNYGFDYLSERNTGRQTNGAFEMLLLLKETQNIER